MTATPKCVSHHYACDCREAMFTDLQDEVGRLRAALKRIAEMDKLTLLCDPADFDFNAEDAYSAGATNAFCEAADVAREALQTPPESADESKPYECTCTWGRAHCQPYSRMCKPQTCVICGKPSHAWLAHYCSEECEELAVAGPTTSPISSYPSGKR